MVIHDMKLSQKYKETQKISTQSDSNQEIH